MISSMLMRIAAVFAFLAAPALPADWNPRLAAQYLDSREKAWVAWPPANKSGVTCVSCHTSAPYLLARPALRRALGESEPPLYEAVLLDGVRATVVKTDAKDLFPGVKGTLADQVYGANAVLAALVLAMDDARRGRLSPEGEQAFARMWSAQIQTGTAKGAWQWSDFDLDPWETPDAAFYGTAIAALATGSAPAGYQARPQIRENVRAMTAYLRGAQQSQPLHNRLILLWASAKLRDLLPEAEQRSIAEEAWRKQQSDGGWTIEVLGGWKKHPDAPAADGSSSYATALAAFTLEQAPAWVPAPGLERALAWLKAHQDPATGSWNAVSMNKKYEADSMPAGFMRDAATSYAALALLSGKPGK